MLRTRPQRRPTAIASKSASPRKATKHLSLDALYDFLQVITPTSSDLATAAHLAACPKCARVARRLRRAQAAVEAWSAETRRRARAIRRAPRGATAR